MNKVVVTGVAGFIGSHLAEELVERGYKVTIIDDLSTGKESNIGKIIGNKNVEFIKSSITDVALLRKVFKNTDYVFHLAAIASVPRSISDPIKAHLINATGTLNVL